MSLVTGIIPARFHSSRFPGKPLALIKGKTMIERVYERASTAKLLDRIIIATDDERIVQFAEKFAADVRMTSHLHRTGTQRVAKIAQDLPSHAIINIQGDEPLIEGEMIDKLAVTLQDKSIPMASLMAKNKNLKLIQDPNIVKVVVDKDNFALYFSRSPLPYEASDYFLQHTGIYGYQRNFLLNFSKMSPSRLEKAENLEQLRALEHGYRIKMIEIHSPTLSIDTPQDIIKLGKILKSKKND